MTDTFFTFNRERSYVKPTRALDALPLAFMRTADPVFNRANMLAEHGVEIQPGFDPLNPELMKGYEDFASHFAMVTNPVHHDQMKALIDRGKTYRQGLMEATGGTALAAEFFDPLNYIGIPMALTAARGATFGVNMMRRGAQAGAYVGAGEAMAEAFVRQPVDPVQSAEETVMNIISATGFGAAFGVAGGAVLGGSSAIVARQARIAEEAAAAEMRVIRHLENAEGLDGEVMRELAATPQAERALGEATVGELRRTIAAGIEGGHDVTPYRMELAARELEGADLMSSDPYRIMPTWFTESPLYKAVSTPFKRTLQGAYPTAVKDIFVRAFNDYGMALAMNAFGRSSPASAYLRSQVAHGRWVKVDAELKELWGEATGASNRSRLDIDLEDLGRRAQRTGDDFSTWVTRLNRKRMIGEELDEIETRALGKVDAYFADAKLRLEKAGLLNTEKGLTTRIEMVAREQDEIMARLDELTNDQAKRTLATRLSEIEEDLQFYKGLRRAVRESGDDLGGIFYPRFWDLEAVRKNRAEFKRILMTWYRENPHTYEFTMKDGGQFLRKDLETNADAIDKRAEATIENILGEADQAQFDQFAGGDGRAKHFRHRQLNVPNELVADFIIQNPIAAMKQYATRVEPRIEFARTFGTDKSGIRTKIQAEMEEAGKSLRQIQLVNRDFVHLYDRVFGYVQKNPDALNKKVAYAMRELASFSYMGSSGLAALADVGRITMEYEMPHVIKGVQAMMDQNTVKLAANETRLAGEAIDILRGSAFLRIMEDMANNVDAQNLLTKSRNAFYIVNGLAPITTIAKQLAGIVDTHEILTYAAKGWDNLSEQQQQWLARHGIDKDFLAVLDEMPTEKTDKGLLMANTEEWTNLDGIDYEARARENLKHERWNRELATDAALEEGRFPQAIDIFGMDDAALVRTFGDQFNVDFISTDPRVMQDVLARRQEEGDWDILLGFHEVEPGMKGSIYVNVKAAREFYDEIRALGPEDQWRRRELIDQTGDLYRDGVISEESYYHRVHLLNAIDLVDTPDEFARFVMYHELHHGTMLRRAGESVGEWEGRIDRAALRFMQDERDGMIRAETDRLREIDLAAREEAVTRFRAALNANVANTIMHGTPADKPIITDGVAYIPSHIGERFGWRENLDTPGYSRIENGFLALPFQFYSFVLANVNKTVGAMATGQVKNRLVGMSVMMGLAYWATSIRTPDYVWRDMNWRDRFSRSFDLSGIAALYSDMFYTAMHTSMALGGPNITGGFISPKYPQEQDILDGILGLAGAGPSWTADTLGGFFDMAQGNVGEGARTIVRNAPGARLWFLKSDINEMTRGWGN